MWKDSNDSGAENAAAAVIATTAIISAEGKPPAGPPRIEGIHVLYRREEQPRRIARCFTAKTSTSCRNGRRKPTPAIPALAVCEHRQRVREQAGQATRQVRPLAVFDRAFEGRPTTPPLVTLTWKDWKGNEPIVAYPRRGVVAPAPLVPTYPSATPTAQPDARFPQPLAEAAAEARVTAAGSAGSVPAPPHGGLAEVNSLPPTVLVDLPSSPVAIAEIGEALRRAALRRPHRSPRRRRGFSRWGKPSSEPRRPPLPPP